MRPIPTRSLLCVVDGISLINNGHEFIIFRNAGEGQEVVRGNLAIYLRDSAWPFLQAKPDGDSPNSAPRMVRDEYPARHS